MTPTDDLTHLYQRMLRIRRVEEKLRDLFAAGKLPGFLHLSIGQEAVAVGICDLLGPDDTLASNHRGHGHSLAKGMDLSGFFAELHGLPAGLCLGRGGSMHVADDRIGMIGANGIVGAGLSLAVGSALAHQVLGREAVAVVFFGDGARAEGLLHESLNLARLWRLPVLFVCENNGWSEFTPGHIGFSGSTPKLAEAFAISYSQADGNDVLAVRESARGALQAIRAGPVAAGMHHASHSRPLRGRRSEVPSGRAARRGACARSDRPGCRAAARGRRGPGAARCHRPVGGC
jgi:pyruvate dehydrogenase E1 component alpha subunit